VVKNRQTKGENNIMASNAVVTVNEQEAAKTTEQPKTEKKGKAPKKAVAAPKAPKNAAPKNGLSPAERKADKAEAAAEAKRLRKKYAPTFKSVAPGVRTNSASGKFEVLVTKYVGAFETLAKAQKARESFIAKVAKIEL
jgi:hypothetical protein